MPRPMQRPGRPANRPGQTRGGRRGRLEAFERRSEQQGNGTGAKIEPGSTITLPPVIVVSELATMLGVGAPQIIKALFTNGIVATINQTLDFDTAAIVASDLGFEVREQSSDGAAASGSAVETSDAAAALADAGPEEDEALLQPRPPVVTIMGHVDHGKTTLLDTLRKSRVAAGEAGGITQHIGAYQVDVDGRRVTFLDTPGHEAFTAMRARGAQVTDIAIIVVAADDGVMPQTKEAISHAKAANVPMIVAITKADMPNANPDKVKQQLTDNDLVVTEYGGNVEAVTVSARTGDGLSDLLDTVLLVTDAEVNPKANPDRPGEGIVVEAQMDKARGPIATVLVQRGTLRVGDVVVAGPHWGKVKALFDDKGNRVKEAGPAYPVAVLGLSGVPAAGDRLRVTRDERVAKGQVEALLATQQRDGEQDNSAEAVFARIRQGNTKELNVIVKADVQGSVEPIVSSLEKLQAGEGEAKAKVIMAGLGNITVTDVNLATASKAMLVAFNVRPEVEAKRAADRLGVTIREYDVIYTLMEDVQQMLAGSVAPRYEDVVHGHLEVRQVIKAGRRSVAGSFVLDGVVRRDDRARLLRGGKTVWEGRVESLRRFKDNVAEVAEGYECGVLLDGLDDVTVGDTIEVYASVRV